MLKETIYVYENVDTFVLEKYLICVV